MGSVQDYNSKCTLVPSQFYDSSCSRDFLAQVVLLNPEDEVHSVIIESYGAYLVYAGRTLPEMYYILMDLGRCAEYNKILCSYHDGLLSVAIAQGGTLMLTNVFKAADFTAAEYFIFLALKQLQLNPEVSTICWRHPIGTANEMSLLCYFKSVQICV